MFNMITQNRTEQNRTEQNRTEQNRYIAFLKIGLPRLTRLAMTTKIIL